MIKLKTGYILLERIREEETGMLPSGVVYVDHRKWDNPLVKGVDMGGGINLYEESNAYQVMSDGVLYDVVSESDILGYER